MKRTRSPSLRHKSTKTPVRKSSKGAATQVRKSTATDQWVGADTSTVVTQELIALATVQLGTKPLFWGRYFKGPGDQNPVRYQAQLEGLILNSNRIRVLPIAQQTNNVALDQSTGHRDGLRNGAAIISSFGQIYLSNLVDGILVFLDVEGPPNPSLSVEYYKGWSNGLIVAGRTEMVEAGASEGIRFLPAVYGPKGDDSTWQSLGHAVAEQAQCAGVCIARPGTIGCHSLREWNDDWIRPKSLSNAIMPLLWQGVQECAGLDYSRLNPSDPGSILNRLILPPNGQETVDVLSSGLS